jgi:probable rRNA maturation factor
MISSHAQKVQFHYLSAVPALTNRTNLKKFLADRLFGQEGLKVNHLNYIFCADAYLLEINKSYLAHDTYTDIITFGLSAVGEPVLADIYISVERVRENAVLFKNSFTRELHRVIFHGALHLCGYKDKTAGQAQQMRSMEQLYLDLYFSR